MINQFKQEMLALVPTVKSGDYEQRQDEILSKSQRIVQLAKKYSDQDELKEVALIDCYIRIIIRCYRHVSWSSQLPKYSVDRFHWEEYLDDIKGGLDSYKVL